MRILFDENVPRKLRLYLIGHSVVTVQEMGWTSFKNGELLKLANEKFDVLMTVDKNLRYQNNFTGLNIGVLTIVVKFNKLQNLIPIVDKILDELSSINLGQIKSIG